MYEKVSKMEVIEEVIEEVIVCRLFDCRSDIEVRISVSDILGPFYGKASL
jgi:hypothetical protein